MRWTLSFCRVLCTNLPLFTKVVFACFDRGSYILRFSKRSQNNWPHKSRSLVGAWPGVQVHIVWIKSSLTQAANKFKARCARESSIDFRLRRSLPPGSAAVGSRHVETRPDSAATRAESSPAHSAQTPTEQSCTIITTGVGKRSIIGSSTHLQNKHHTFGAGPGTKSRGQPPNEFSVCWQSRVIFL